MRKKFDLAFRRQPKKVNANLYIDETDNPVDILKMLRDAFPDVKNRMIRVRVIADDGLEKECPFDIQLAAKVLSGEIKGRFTDTSDKDIKIFATDLEGEHPVLGIYDGAPMQWNKTGNASDRDDKKSLKIIVSNE